MRASCVLPPRRANGQPRGAGPLLLVLLEDARDPSGEPRVALLTLGRRARPVVFASIADAVAAKRQAEGGGDA